MNALREAKTKNIQKKNFQRHLNLTLLSLKKTLKRLTLKCASKLWKLLPIEKAWVKIKLFFTNIFCQVNKNIHIHHRSMYITKIKLPFVRYSFMCVCVYLVKIIYIWGFIFKLTLKENWEIYSSCFFFFWKISRRKYFKFRRRAFVTSFFFFFFFFLLKTRQLNLIFYLIFFLFRIQENKDTFLPH